MRWSFLMLLTVAPAVYAFLGAPLLVAGRGRRPSDRLAPLLGCVLSGWLGEMALVAGVPCRFAYGAASAAAAVMLAARWREAGRFTECLRELYTAYLPAAAIIMLSASPAATSFWINDWQEQYQMGQGVLAGDYSGAPIHREPLFAAAAIPLQVAFAPLPSLMAFAAVAAAAAALAIIYGAEVWGEVRLTSASLAPLLATPFFLLHVATVWAKLLAAGAVVAAMADAAAYRKGSGRSAWLTASLWLAAGIAVHKSSVIYLGLLAPLYPFRRVGWRAAARDAAMLGAALLLIAGPFDAWIVSHRGLKERVAANPVVYYSSWANGPIVLTKALNLISSLTGNPLKVRVFPTAVQKAAYWAVWEAGTLLGTFWPFIPTILAREGWRALVPRTPEGRGLAAGGMAVVALNALLNPYPASHGLTQTGLTPLCLLIFLWFFIVGWARVGALAAVLAAGTLPLLLVNSVVLFDLATRGTAPYDPSQYIDMVRLGETSTGLGLWPLSLPLGWALMLGYLWLTARHERLTLSHRA